MTDDWSIWRLGYLCFVTYFRHFRRSNEFRAFSKNFHTFYQNLLRGQIIYISYFRKLLAPNFAATSLQFKLLISLFNTQLEYVNLHQKAISTFTHKSISFQRLNLISYTMCGLIYIHECSMHARDCFLLFRPKYEVGWTLPLLFEVSLSFLKRWLLCSKLMLNYFSPLITLPSNQNHLKRCGNKIKIS